MWIFCPVEVPDVFFCFEVIVYNACISACGKADRPEALSLLAELLETVTNPGVNFSWELQLIFRKQVQYEHEQKHRRVTCCLLDLPGFPIRRNKRFHVSCCWWNRSRQTKNNGEKKQKKKHEQIGQPKCMWFWNTTLITQETIQDQQWFVSLLATTINYVVLWRWARCVDCLCHARSMPQTWPSWPGEKLQVRRTACKQRDLLQLSHGGALTPLPTSQQANIFQRCPTENLIIFFHLYMFHLFF